MKNPSARGAGRGARGAGRGARGAGREAAAAPKPVPQGRIAPGERGAEIYLGSSFLSVYDSSFGGHQ